MRSGSPRFQVRSVRCVALLPPTLQSTTFQMPRSHPPYRFQDAIHEESGLFVRHFVSLFRFSLTLFPTQRDRGNLPCDLGPSTYVVSTSAGCAGSIDA